LKVQEIRVRWWDRLQSIW